MDRFDVAHEELDGIARGFGYEGCCYEPEAWSMTRGGIAYDSLCSGGIKPEGERFPHVSKTPEEALRSYALSLKAYLAARRWDMGGKRVYWRHTPELIEFEAGGCAIYSRLAVDD